MSLNVCVCVCVCVRARVCTYSLGFLRRVSDVARPRMCRGFTAPEWDWEESCRRRTFCKVLFIASVYSKYTRALTFESLCEQASLWFSLLASSLARASRWAFGGLPASGLGGAGSISVFSSPWLSRISKNKISSQCPRISTTENWRLLWTFEDSGLLRTFEIRARLNDYHVFLKQQRPRVSNSPLYNDFL